jgi:phosphoglycolate phosphatase
VEAQPVLKAALLDFDETLVILPVDWDSLRNQLAQIFTPYGLTPPLRPLYAGIRDAFAELQARGVSPVARGHLRRRLNTMMTATELASAPDATAVPGSRELITTLSSLGAKVIIQTSNSVRVVQEVLQRLSFPPVDAIIGRESGRRPKPHPSGVRRTLSVLGVRGNETVVIGDGDYDIELGRTIGALTIRFGKGRHAVSADHEIESLEEAARILTKNRQPHGASVC